MRPISYLLASGLLLFSLNVSAQFCIPSVTTLNGLAVNLLPVSPTLVAATVNLNDLHPFASSPCASGPMTYAMRKSGTGTGMPSGTSLQFTCDEIGTQLVEVWAKDAAGNTNYAETYVLVQDNDVLCTGAPPTASVDCANDEVAPKVVALNGLAISVIPGKSKKGWARVNAADLAVAVTDNCSGPITLRLRKSGTGTGAPSKSYVVFNCTDIGLQLLELWAGDAQGNWSYSETYILVQDENHVCGNTSLTCSPVDQVPPVVVALNGLAISVNNNAKATVTAYDLILRASDFCSGVQDVRIAKAFGGNPNVPPTTNFLTFDCSELGTQSVILWVQDNAGNWSRVRTYLIIQDNVGICAPAPAVTHTAIPGFKTALSDQLESRIARQMEPVATIQSREEAFPDIDAAIAPNPTSGTFVLSASLEEPGMGSIYLYDRLGRQVRVLAQQQQWDAGEWEQTFSIGDLPDGLYWCVLATDSGMQKMALVKG